MDEDWATTHEVGVATGGGLTMDELVLAVGRVVATERTNGVEEEPLWGGWRDVGSEGRLD